MKTFNTHKVVIFTLLAIAATGLTGCMHHTVVSSHPVSHSYHSKVLISSNSAYYERYGYPSSYYEPHYQPKTIVVKKVKVVPVKTIYKDKHYKNHHHHKPIHSKPHRPESKTVYKKQDKHHKSIISQKRMPIKHYEKPKIMHENSVTKNRDERRIEQRIVKQDGDQKTTYRESSSENRYANMKPQKENHHKERKSNRSDSQRERKSHHKQQANAR